MGNDKAVVLCIVMFLLVIGCSNPKNGTVTSKNGLVLRSEPSSNAKNMAHMPLGSIVIIQDTNGPKETLYDITANWYRVSYNDKEGWAFGGFIKQIKSDVSNSYKSNNRNYVKYYEYKNNEFELIVNLCEGMGSVYGKYQHEDSIIKCQVSKTDFSGFRGDTITKFNFKIINENTIEYDGDGIGCDPNKGDTLTKF